MRSRIVSEIFWHTADRRLVTARTIAMQIVAPVAFASFLACSAQDPVTGATSGGSSNAGGAVASGGMATSGGAQASGGSGASGGATGSSSGGAAPSAGASAGGIAGSDGSSGGAGGYVPSGPCSPPVDVKNPIEKLSQTGCMDASDLRKMANIVIPYDVNSPLWSDNANKTRGMVIPAGQKIHVKNCTANPDECLFGPQDEGHWVFPVGSVLIKNFIFDDKYVETRLFVRRDTKTWVGYGYQWNEEQTEATIVPDDGRKVTFNTGQRQVSWSYPSRYDCMLCHNKPSGSTIGPETRQLNRVIAGQNQLEKLESLGVFELPPGKPYLAPLVTPYPSFEGQAPEGTPKEQLARSYLHANCAFCHRADGNPGTIDLRYDVALKDTNICNVAPQKNAPGLPATGMLLTPGDPAHSVLVARMQSLDDMARMPQIGTYVVDDQAVKLVSDWISSITTCPE